MNLKPWRHVDESEASPLLFGFARDFPWQRKGNALFILIPFNLIYRFLYSLLMVLKFPKDLWWERNMRIKYQLKNARFMKRGGEIYKITPVVLEFTAKDLEDDD